MLLLEKPLKSMNQCIEINIEIKIEINVEINESILKSMKSMNQCIEITIEINEINIEINGLKSKKLL